MTAAPIATCSADVLAEFTMNKNAVQILDGADHPQVRVGALTRGPEILAENTVSQGLSVWASTRWTTSNARNSRDYVQFTLKADGSYIQLDRTSFNIERSENLLDPSDNGPARWELRYSLDGFVSHDELIEDWAIDRNGGFRIEVSDLTLGAIRFLRPGDEVEFRLYGYKASSSDGVGAVEGVWEVLGNPVQPLALFEPVNSLGDLHDVAYRDGVVVSPMTRGPGIVGTTEEAGWVSNGWDRNGVFTDYLETTITATGGPVALDRASYTLYRDVGPMDLGPASWELRYSINDGPVFLLDSPVFPDGASTLLRLNLDISSIPLLLPGDVLSLRWIANVSALPPDPSPFAGAGFSSDGPVLITGTASRALARYIPARTNSSLVDRANAASVTASDLRRGPGLTAYTGSEFDDGFLARGWANGIINFEDDYFETTIQAVTAPVTFTGARYRLYRINESTFNGGAANWRFRASVNGGPEVDLRDTDFAWPSGGPRSGVIDVSLDALPMIFPGGQVRFRWYGYVSGGNDQAGFAAGTEVTIYGADGTGTSSARPTGFQLWQAQSFPGDYGMAARRATVWGRDADPDDDGKTNLAEYLLLCGPHRFEIYNLEPEYTGDLFRFTVNVRDDPLAGIFGVFDTDLNFADAVSSRGILQSSDGETGVILFRAPAIAPARFARLEVDYPN